jgi:hypothetical protein
MSSTIEKTLNLAFHPSTGEAEAIVAFLAARRLRAGEVDYKGFVKQNVLPKTPPSQQKEYKLFYEATVTVRKLPLLFQLFEVEFKGTKYTILNKSEKWNALGSIEIELNLYFPDVYTMELCQNEFDYLFEEYLNGK